MYMSPMSKPSPDTITMLATCWGVDFNSPLVVLRVGSYDDSNLLPTPTTRSMLEDCYGIKFDHISIRQVRMKKESFDDMFPSEKEI